MNVQTLFICGVIGIFLTASCDVNQSSDALEQESEASLSNEISKMVDDEFHKQKVPGQIFRVIPFEGSFFTAPAGRPMPHERCADPALLITQVGEGQMTPLGGFTFHSTFCIDQTAVAPPLGGDGQLTEGEAMPYYSDITTFTFANGDELHARGGSAVFPPEDPDSEYDAQFSHPFAIVGGTGRFENAKGGGTTESLVSFQKGTDHKFSGVIVLAKHRGNRP